MIDKRAASRYAQALFGLASEKKQSEPVDKELLYIKSVLDKHREVTHLVLNSTVSFEEKSGFLDKVFASSVSPLVFNFLKVLIRKNRFHEFSEIQKIHHRLYEAAQGITEVTVITRFPLKPEGEAKLLKILERKLKAKVRLIAEIDPKMIGGLILRFNGQEINASFKNRLLQIRQSLMA